MTREKEKETRVETRVKRRDEKIISSLHFFANKHPKKKGNRLASVSSFFFFFFAKHKRKGRKTFSFVVKIYMDVLWI
jgi:hypothetical protein